MSIRPYISLDIETTGLPLDKVDLLEIGWVIDDGVTPFDQLERHNYIIRRSELNYASLFALKMNKRIIDALMEGDHPDIKVASEIAERLIDSIYRCSDMAIKWDKNNGLYDPDRPNRRIQFAGKNFLGFDKPIVTRWLNDAATSDQIDVFNKMVQHRAIDVGAMYYSDFGFVPSLQQINDKFFGGSTVSHKAIEDADDVVKAVRLKMDKQ